MEVSLRKSDDGVLVVKEERRVESTGDGQGYKDQTVLKDNQLESAKAEMGSVREENQRLRMHLSRIMKDYQTLRMQYHDIVGQEEAKESKNTADTVHHETEEPELVSLSLGRTSSDMRKDIIEKPSKGKEDRHDEEGLALGLDCKFEVSKTTTIETSLKLSSENSSDEVKDEGGESWPPSKGVKTMRSEDEVLQGNPVKKTRVSVRVRCDTPTMIDGCQWRKYGQKIAKGNPCPRAYYRCTIAPSCPVRKQVQRCAEDMSILITTYEGTHNHPLPNSATAMASTTSAAASMLMSGSSSTSGLGPTSSTAITTSAGLNFYLSDNPKSNQFCFPYNSSISSSPSYPTITLDLTSTSSSSSSSSNFSKISSNFLSTPRYSSTNLNFNSWSNTGVLNYGAQQPYNRNNQAGALSFARQPQENFYQSFMQRTNPSYPNNPTPPQQPLPPDSIAAATKAITSDPSFQSALAAALTSIIGAGSGGGGGGGTLGYQGGDKFGQNLNLGESFPGISNFPSTVPSSTNKCSSAVDPQPGSKVFLQPSSPFSTSKSKSTSPSDRDHIV